MLPHLLKRPDMYARTPNPEPWKPRETSIKMFLILNFPAMILLALGLAPAAAKACPSEAAMQYWGNWYN